MLRERYLAEPPRTLRQIAEGLGITAERVRQLEPRALRKTGLAVG